MKTFLSRHLYFFLIAILLVTASGGISPAQPASAAASNQPMKNPSSGTAEANASLEIHPLERVMIGEDFEFYVTFNNLSDPGYGPFVDLIFPTNGMDGAAGTSTPDGITFVDAEFMGVPLKFTTLTFPAPDPLIVPTPATTCVSHPLAFDTTGTAAQVCGIPGDTLVVLELPLSSVTSNTPEMWIKVTAHVSDLADVDSPLTILSRGGYRYGLDSLNNPVSDPSILDPNTTDGAGWAPLTVTPRVIYIEKSFNGPEECPYLLPDQLVLDETQCPYGNVNPVYESVSGPNYPWQYTITVTVAKGQTVTNLNITDFFPNNLAYLSVFSLGGGTLVETPSVGVAANAPNNDLIVNFNSVTGNAVIVVDFFIPELDANNNPVLDPITGNSAVAENIASGLGDWIPVDPRDSASTGNAIANGPCPACSSLHTLNIRSIATQKSVSIANDTGAPGYTPGDTLKYTIDFQISDYFSFGNIIITDVLSDGQRFTDTGAYKPTISVSDRNTTLTDQTLAYTFPGAPTPADELTIDQSQILNTGPGVTDDGSDGSTTLTFDISKAMVNAAATDGILQGGEAGYSDSPTNTVPATGAVPASGSVTFYAVIQEDFSDTYPSGDSSVDHGDALFNSATLSATIADDSAALTANSQSNDSTQKVEIDHSWLTGEIYAINGSTSFTTTAVKPNDTITFRLGFDLPTTDSDYLTFTDYLPMPILNAGEVITFDNITDATVPAAGHAKFGSADTASKTPTITQNAPANSLIFDFGSFDDPADAGTHIDLLYTLTVTNAPYADGSLLTDFAMAVERTTNNGSNYHAAASAFTLKEPNIGLHKSAVANNNSAGVFLPALTIPFNAPGSNPSWSGVISSSTGAINSDVTNMRSDDMVTFAIVLENLGSSELGAFDVSFKDTLPANFIIPAGGINLQIKRGDGAIVSYSALGSTATEPSGLFDDGIILANDSPSQGVAHVYDASNGTNVVVVTYDLQIASNLPQGTIITNTASLLSYAGTNGGPNHVGAAPTSNIHTDIANAILTLPAPPVITEGESIEENISENNSPTPFGLTLHATDPNFDPLTWSILTPPTYGTAGIGSTTGVVSYTPYLNYNGFDSFVAQVSDGKGFTDTITVNINIQPAPYNGSLIWNQSYEIKYDTWYGATNSNAFGGGYRKATSGDFTFKPNKIFNRIKWITYRGPDQGKAQVLVDGAVKATIDLYHSTPQWQYAIEITGLKNGKHTVTIRPLNTKNSHSSGKWVTVDAFAAGATSYDERQINQSNLFSYNTWTGIISPATRFGAYRISNKANSTMNFSFDGVTFNWVTARGPAYGKAAIYVDGKLVKTVDLYKASQQWRYRITVNGLSYGHHTVTIKVLGTKNSSSAGTSIICDGFEIN